jgi:hypothetical protein
MRFPSGFQTKIMCSCPISPICATYVNLIFVVLITRIVTWVSIYTRSKANTVFGRSNIGIAGSNPARGMDVCLRFCVVLSFVGRGLGAGLIPRPRSPTKCLKGSVSKNKNPTP